MPRRTIRVCLCLLLVVGAGCIGSPYGYPDDPPEDEDCVYPDGVDPNVPKCYVSTHPADLELINDGGESQNLSIEVVFEDAETVYADDLSLAPRDTTVEEDVFDRSGKYTIRATLSGSETIVETWTLQERYVGEGGPGWIIGISESGELSSNRAGHM